MSRTAARDALDPRSIVTPEAFEISPDLLGIPLAGPLRRLFAILVDLALVALLTRAGGLLLGVLAAIFVIRLATGPRKSDALARTFRLAVGCLGGVILLVTGCGLWLVFGGGHRGDLADRVQARLGDQATTASIDLGDVFGGISEARALRTAPSEAAAVVAATRMARRLERIGAPRDEIGDALREIAPDDAPWRGRQDRNVQAALADSGATDSTLAGGGAPPDTGALGAFDTVNGAGAAGAGTTASPAPPEPAVAPAATSVGTPEADTVAELRRRLADESQGRIEAERRLEESRQELEHSREGWLLPWLRGLADELGLAFGWGTLYMTVFLAWWKGRTPGKRLLGIRAVHLDGTPITWWGAFERAGGYAAGFATGLLGFAQVFWDPNRQAIHDKIARTVVVLDGAEPVPGPWRKEPRGVSR